MRWSRTAPMCLPLLSTSAQCSRMPLRGLHLVCRSRYPSNESSMVLSRFPNAARNPIVLMLPSTGVPRVSGLASVRCRLLLGLFTGCAAHKRHAALVCAVAILSSQATAGFAQINTHHIGNSLTGQILGPNYSTRLRALTQVEGARQVSNQQDIRANRTLTHFVDVPVPDGSSAAHYGSAFANSKIDALFLQP